MVAATFAILMLCFTIWGIPEVWKNREMQWYFTLAEVFLFASGVL